MNIQTDRACVPADTTVVRHLLIQITAPGRRQHTERPPAEVALVLDRSGSMGGRKLEMAKRAVKHAIQLLGARDRLAIVTYDNDVDTLLETTEAVPEAKALAMSRLQAIDARGGTDLHAGWARGAALLAGSPATADVTRRVLLLSDGQANQGETNPEVLAQYAAELRATGITTTTFGLGADFDEQLMSSLSTQGGGNFYFIEHPAQIADFFTSELGETLEVVARDVRLLLAGGPQVQFACLNHFPVQRAPHASDVHIQLGDLVADQHLTIGTTNTRACYLPASGTGLEAAVRTRRSRQASSGLTRHRGQGALSRPRTVLCRHRVPRVLKFLSSHQPPLIAKVYRAAPRELERNANAPGRVEIWYPKAG